MKTLRVRGIILKVDQRSTEQIISDKSSYTPASNDAIKYRNIAVNYLKSNKDRMGITFERNGIIDSLIINWLLFYTSVVIVIFEPTDECELQNKLTKSLSNLFPQSHR